MDSFPLLFSLVLLNTWQIQYLFPTRSFYTDKAFTEGKFGAALWQAGEVALTEPKLYQDDERNVLRPFPGAICVFASAG